jgi:hypothetical protein
MLSSKVDLPHPLSPTKIVTSVSRPICLANFTAGILKGNGFCLLPTIEKDFKKGIKILGKLLIKY